eukprot:CAMPEP_0198347250 /NCGR_PEP_ID=MMETSP1450-20131203/83830_1 /TAXON_ID=753684 ORGANISM="Madagascaria erythrocladiodes, Strain CCMP3234" /NCGR_SAMPLE_ID=MMETSP1450 /ASSEMBLY_ACC=CAM_ASM_001115 /LENGTH=33 /DNA_ID= /DNA_START= /DNA_END= /DNA_ORIENTATION=
MGLITSIPTPKPVNPSTAMASNKSRVRDASGNS